MIGQTLAHFRIMDRLGQGGMGAVYRAQDLKLGREVAIKVLLDDFTTDPVRLARFRHEAKVLASLNHPGIVTVYSLETTSIPSTSHTANSLDELPNSSMISFLVMELVDGHTLSEEIQAGEISLARFFELAVPLVGTIGVAHEQGIIHRDIKPGNIMVSPSGSVKVLDFGLAKRQAIALEPEGVLPTETLVQYTRDGQIVGTIPYMSPEQVRAGELDPRSDVFSLGVVLFEMIAGKRPFRGGTPADLMSSILNEAPLDLSVLRPECPSDLVVLIRRCLAKNRDHRVDSAQDLARELDLLAKTASNAAGNSATKAATALTPELDSDGTDPVSSGRVRRKEFDPRAVAVLPFENLGAADEVDFLAAGLHNDLITELSRVVGLTVISRNSVMGYRGTAKPAPVIARELNVGTIIGGTVQSAGNRVRMTAHLVDAVADVHRWGEHYDRELSPETLFAIQSELTQRIVESLHSKLALDQDLPAGKLQTKDLEAYRLNTLGRMQLDLRTETGIAHAVEHFEQAIERDPQYVLAWVGLADALTLTASYGYGNRDDLLSRAHAASVRALELDPDSAEAHASLGLYYGTVRDGPASMLQTELAIRIQPGYADAHNWMSYWQNLSGRAPDALSSARRAVELNPLSAEAVSNLSLSLLTNGEDEKALIEAHHVAELSPEWSTAQFYEGIALYDLGRYREAAAALSGITVEWAGLGAEATLALTHVALGEEDRARQLLHEIAPEVDAFAAGLVHLALGEVDTAFELFLRADYLNDWPILAVHHLYRDLWDTAREHLRYEEILRHAFRSYGMGSLGKAGE